MNKQKYSVTLTGCDDYNEFEVELTSSELETVRNISELSKIHSYVSCQPVLTIEEVTNEQDGEKARIED